MGPEPCVRGDVVALDAAATAAAALLAGSRSAVITGLATDIAGAEAAIALARRVGGVIDHTHADAMLRDLDVMRQAGAIVTTPSEARARADVVLLVGPGPAFPDTPPTLFPDRPRHVLRLGDDPTGLPECLGLLRALVAERPIDENHARLAASLASIAHRVRAASYGVAVWSAASLDPLSIEMLCGLIDDLNRKTRFAGLPIPPAGNAAGVAQACAWATGYPVRVSFARDVPEQDCWRFDTTRMIEAGEADVALWVCACTPRPPPWRRPVPLIALAPPGTRFHAPPEVAIPVGRPGIDHAAILFDTDLSALICNDSSASNGLPSVADVLQRIIARC